MGNKTDTEHKMMNQKRTVDEQVMNGSRMETDGPFYRRETGIFLDVYCTCNSVTLSTTP